VYQGHSEGWADCGIVNVYQGHSEGWADCGKVLPKNWRNALTVIVSVLKLERTHTVVTVLAYGLVYPVVDRVERHDRLDVTAIDSIDFSD